MSVTGDVVSLDLPELGRGITTWKDYAVNSHFLTPTDGFSLTLGDDETGDELIQALAVGLKVQLSVDGRTQLTGYIDEIEIAQDRQGTTVTVNGRDLLGKVVDASLDPTLKFSAGQTLEVILRTVFADFGIRKVSVDAAANRNILTGAIRGVKRTPKLRKVPKDFRAHQLKPYPNEGAWSFVSRISQRFGLWLWLGAQGDLLIVGKPDFDQDTTTPLVRKRGAAGAANNVLYGSCSRSALDQPSCIVAFGRGAGAEHPRSGMVAIAVNDVVNGSDVEAIKARYTGASVLTNKTSQSLTPYASPARALYLQDSESNTPEQLEYFAQRELSLRQRKAFTARYVVEGHINAFDGHAYAIDTMVKVDDDVLNIHENLWVLSRTFKKSRQGGTTTELELIRPNTLTF